MTESLNTMLPKISLILLMRFIPSGVFLYYRICL